MIKSFKIAFWVYLLAIVVVSVIPSAGITRVNINNSIYRVDYALHALAFFILPILAFLAASNKLGFSSKLWWFMIILSLLVAILTEFVQIYVPGRRFNPLDIYSNLLGLLIGVVTVKFYQVFKP
jgi:VanZ family protein